MARLRYNLIETTLGASLSNVATSITFATALQEGGVNIPTIGASDFLPLTLSGVEVVYLTAYTSGATSGTILRDPPDEDSLQQSHANAALVQHNPTKLDYGGGGSSFSIKVAANNSSDQDTDAADFVCTGTNDEAVFQDIIDTYGPGTLLVIEVAVGTYNFDAQCNLNCSADLHIIGAAGPSTGYPYSLPDDVNIAKTTTGAYSAFALDIGGGHRYLAGLYLYHDNSEAISDALIEMEASSTLTLDGVTVFAETSTNSPAVQMIGGGDLVMRDCYLSADDTYALSLPSTGSGCDVTLNRCLFETYGSATASVGGTNIDGSMDFVAQDCWFSSSTIGLRIDGDTGNTPMPRVLLTDCTVNTSNGDGYYLSDISHLEVHGGHNFGAINGGTLFRLSNVDSGIIEGFITPANYGISHHAVWLLDCDNVHVTGNTFLNYGQITDDTYSGVILDGDTNNCQIINNRIRTLPSANKALYGIRVDDSTCDNNLVEGNDLLASAKTNGNEFSDAGTGTRGWEERELAYVAGNVAVAAGVKRNRFARPAVLGLTLLNANTAPVSTAILVDVHKDGTTIYTTQASRPTIAAAGVAGQSVALPDVKYIAAASYLTADVDQIGTGTVGADLVVLQRYMPI